MDTLSVIGLILAVIVLVIGAYRGLGALAIDTACFTGCYIDKQNFYLDWILSVLYEWIYKCLFQLFLTVL